MISWNGLLLELFTFFVGVMLFKKISISYRLVLVSLYISLIRDVKTKIYFSEWFNNNSIFVENIHMLIQLGSLFLAAYFLIDLNKIRKYLWGGFSFFFVFWLIETLFSGNLLYNYNSHFLGSLVILISYFVVLYLSVLENNSRLILVPSLWLSICMIFSNCYSCIVSGIYRNVGTYYNLNDLNGLVDNIGYALGKATYIICALSFILNYRQNCKIKNHV